jgi:DNA-binding transcriptional ArsR family regulator
VAHASALLDVLADPTRRALVDALRHGPLTVSELASRVPVSRSAVSQHLRLLSDKGIVDHRAVGTSRHYRLQEQALGELRDYVCGLWDDALASFVNEVPRRRRRPQKTRSPR